MPTVMTTEHGRFFFYSAVGDMAPHVWVRSNGGEAMVWLHDVSVASSSGYGEDALQAIVRTVAERREELLQAWAEHFGVHLV